MLTGSLYYFVFRYCSLIVVGLPGPNGLHLSFAAHRWICPFPTAHAPSHRSRPTESPLDMQPPPPPMRETKGEERDLGKVGEMRWERQEATRFVLHSIGCDDNVPKTTGRGNGCCCYWWKLTSEEVHPD
uniref:Uncharacterized protein n=1 Tax=Oryza meridionalis TaxID=40149 RepID=A0A0E0C194_9ORYZ